MDPTPFKEMLLRKRGDIISGGGRDPLTVTYRTVPALGLAIAFIKDPWGTNIELTEGLAELD